MGCLQHVNKHSRLFVKDRLRRDSDASFTTYIFSAPIGFYYVPSAVCDVAFAGYRCRCGAFDLNLSCQIDSLSFLKTVSTHR